MVEAIELRKDFAEVTAVEEISLRVAAGEVYGLLGPNGAGKTTTLRMLAGLIRPTAGRILLDGADILQDPCGARAQLGFQSGSAGLYARLTPLELLRYFGRLHQVPRDRVEQRVAALGEQFELTAFWGRRCDTLSSGQRQRVSLARTLLHDPRLLILDEPGEGLDIWGSRLVANTVKGARAEGRAVILSTHHMAEAELLCDRVGLLHSGVLLWEGSPDELRAQTGARSLEQAFIDLVERGIGVATEGER